MFFFNFLFIHFSPLRAFAELPICAPCDAPEYLMHSLKFLLSPPTTDWSSTIAREFRKEPLDQLKVLLEILVSPILRGIRHRIGPRIPAKSMHFLSRMPSRIERTRRVIQASRRAARSTN